MAAQPRNTRKRTAALLPILLLILISSPAWAEICKSSGTPEALAIVLPHLPFQPGPDGTQGRPKVGTAAEAYLAFHTASIREIEQLTGLDLLPKLDAESLKRSVARELWLRN